ncbi:hypothetical protein D9M68_534820 [compost metagenome]
MHLLAVARLGILRPLMHPAFHGHILNREMRYTKVVMYQVFDHLHAASMAFVN